MAIDFASQTNDALLFDCMLDILILFFVVFYKAPEEKRKKKNRFWFKSIEALLKKREKIFCRKIDIRKYNEQLKKRKKSFTGNASMYW